jgi:hypothetical protein
MLSSTARDLSVFLSDAFNFGRAFRRALLLGDIDRGYNLGRDNKSLDRSGYKLLCLRETRMLG